MDTPPEKTIRRNSIVMSILIIIAVFAMLAFLAFYSSLKTICAVLAFTIAILLPIRQKRFSLYSLFLVLSGILFLLSGVIENIADTLRSSLATASQIERIRFISAREVSLGLWNIGIGICNVMLAWSWIAFRAKSQPARTTTLSYLAIGAVGILFVILGASSIIEGLRR